MTVLQTCLIMIQYVWWYSCTEQVLWGMCLIRKMRSVSSCHWLTTVSSYANEEHCQLQRSSEDDVDYVNEEGRIHEKGLWSITMFVLGVHLERPRKMRKERSQTLLNLKLKSHVSLFQVIYSSLGQSAKLNSLQLQLTVWECAGHI